MKENRSYLPRESRLPLYGIGPVYVAVIITVTMAGILLSQFKIIAYLSFPIIKDGFADDRIFTGCSGSGIVVFGCFQGKDRRRNHKQPFGDGRRVCTGEKSDLFGIFVCLHRHADDLWQFMAADTAGFILAVLDCADEMYRGKVAEKFIWCGI